MLSEPVFFSAEKLSFSTLEKSTKPYPWAVKDHVKNVALKFGVPLGMKIYQFEPTKLKIKGEIFSQKLLGLQKIARAAISQTGF